MQISNEEKNGFVQSEKKEKPKKKIGFKEENTQNDSDSQKKPSCDEQSAENDRKKLGHSEGKNKLDGTSDQNNTKHVGFGATKQIQGSSEKKARFADEEANNKTVLSSEQEKNQNHKNLGSSMKKARFEEKDESEENERKKLLAAEEESKIELDKTKKKLIFADENEENNKNEEVSDRQRSRTNYTKQSIPDTGFDLSGLSKPRSKSCDTGKTQMESENKEIDEMFEVLANFQALRLNKKYLTQ